MKIAASILNIKEPKKEEINILSNLDIDYVHLDIMDGIFVESITYNYEEFYNMVTGIAKPLDVHLMVSDVKKYIDSFSMLNPEYITFHYEAVSDIRSVINYIKEKGIKVGLSIKPTTEVSEIYDYLDYIDLVLVMSVDPGYGGQEFIDDSTKKIEQLYNLRENNNYHYLIQVDGGINNETIRLCNYADICVVGSYITKSSNYEIALSKLK